VLPREPVEASDVRESRLRAAASEVPPGGMQGRTMGDGDTAAARVRRVESRAVDVPRWGLDGAKAGDELVDNVWERVVITVRQEWVSRAPGTRRHARCGDRTGGST
jgi:hypothetical protein